MMVSFNLNKKGQEAVGVTWILAFIAIFLFLLMLGSGAFILAVNHKFFGKGLGERIEVRSDGLIRSGFLPTESVISFLEREVSFEGSNREVKDLVFDYIDSSDGDIEDALGEILDSMQFCAFEPGSGKQVKGYAFYILKEDAYKSQELYEDYGDVEDKSAAEFESEEFDEDDVEKDSFAFLMVPRDGEIVNLAFFRSGKKVGGDKLNGIKGCA